MGYSCALGEATAAVVLCKEGDLVRAGEGEWQSEPAFFVSLMLVTTVAAAVAAKSIISWAWVHEPPKSWNEILFQ